MEYMNVITNVDYSIPSVSILIRFSDYMDMDGYLWHNYLNRYTIKLPFKNIFLFVRIVGKELFYICIITFERKIVRSYRLFLEM